MGPVLRAGFAHLWFIHPFADGNGRIARAIALNEAGEVEPQLLATWVRGGADELEVCAVGEDVAGYNATRHPASDGAEGLGAQRGGWEQY